MKPALSVLLAVAYAYAADPLPTSKPDEVGLSGERLARVHRLIDRYIQRGEIAGAVTVVARHGRLAHFEAQGKADLEAGSPMRGDTIFRMASMTKPIASLAVLMLLEEQQFLLHDPVSRFLPEFRNPKVAVAAQGAPGGYRLVPAEREITIHDLLTHRSGLATAASPATDLMRKFRAGFSSDNTLEEFSKMFSAVPLNFQPGTAWEYGASTDLLGRLVEVASGQSFDVFLQERIFQPLGMKDTHFYLPLEKLPRLAPLYQKEADRPLVRMESPAPNVQKGRFFSGGGGLVSTPGDYLRFCQMLLNGGELDGKRLVGRKTVELMTSNAIGRHSIPIDFLRGYGFGLGVAVRGEVGDAGLLGSPGSYRWSGAYNTYFRIDPKEDVVLVLFVQSFPPNDIGLQHGFHNAVMQAVVDRVPGK